VLPPLPPPQQQQVQGLQAAAFKGLSCHQAYRFCCLVGPLVQ
jgi:hypothetical protein